MSENQTPNKPDQEEKTEAQRRSEFLLQKVTDESQEFRLHELKNNFEDLMYARELELVTIFEDQFREVFMPYFCKNENPFNVDDQKWCEIAGGHYREVRVVDRNNNFCFIVPAIYDRESYNPNSPAQGQNMYEEYQTSSNRTTFNPSAVLDGLQIGLIERMARGGNPESGIRKIRLWNNILRFYGLEPIKIEGMDDVYPPTNDELEAQRRIGEQGSSNGAQDQKSGISQISYQDLD